MVKVKKVKQLVVTCSDKAGKLAEVTGALAGAKVNMQAIMACGCSGKAWFAVLTDNNLKAKAALKGAGFNVGEEGAVAVSLPDKPGALAYVAGKLAAKNVNLEYCYVTACGCGGCFLILRALDNNKIMTALKK
jgi:hypothetical protein